MTHLYWTTWRNRRSPRQGRRCSTRSSSRTWPQRHSPHLSREKVFFLIRLFIISSGSNNTYVRLSDQVPLKIGVIFHTPSPPMVKNCPTASSMKNIGIPAMITVRIYGTKNAPGQKHGESISPGQKLSLIYHALHSPYHPRSYNIGKEIARPAGRKKKKWKKNNSKFPWFF